MTDIIFNRFIPGVSRDTIAAALCAIATSVISPPLQAADPLPIADAHVHYSHDSVEMTPPERVIEIMREANLKFALVSSSDDTGTQLLAELASDLVIPGLRPYRRRGELGTWYTDPEALVYVEKLLKTHRYASLGEFHIYGEDADLPNLRRLVELADEYNLVLHAHSDADAVERLLAQSPTVKVLWAHSGFDGPEAIATMLAKHDRLWADLAFRSEVGSGGTLSADWKKLFTDFPDRMMLGTDTFTPERMYFIPQHAQSAREWLSSLPDDLAEKVAWKNAYALLMPIWEANKSKQATNSTTNDLKLCSQSPDNNTFVLGDNGLSVRIQPTQSINVSEPFSAKVSLCGKPSGITSVTLDARMPAHGHGMNYSPEHTIVITDDSHKVVNVKGIVLHMPGEWQWLVRLEGTGDVKTLTHDFSIE